MPLTRKQAFGGLAALGIGLAMAGGAVANDGDKVASIESEANTYQAAVQQIDVPWADNRDITRDGVQSLAATLSENAQTIVLYQPTNGIWDATLQGARENIFSGESALNGMILAAGEQREIAFYANGQLTGTILNPVASELSEDVKSKLAKDYQDYIKPLGVAMNANADGAENGPLSALN